MYDRPNRQKYAFQYDAGGTADETFTVQGPKGKKGRLVDYGVEGVTELFDAAAQVAVGTAADPDAYGEEIAIGALAVDGVKTLRTMYDPGKDKAAYDALVVQPILPADTKVVLSITKATTTGIGTFFMTIEWDD
jgi:hypothetical protein